MIFLQLYLTFLKIGLFSFGGGYGMLPLMLEETTSRAWLTESEFASFLAIAESTPGPIAVNMATYVGSVQGGILGSVLATLGVMTPSVIIIILIVAVFKNFLQYQGVRSALNGMKPVICGLILATGVTLLLTNILPNIKALSFDGFKWQGLLITLLIGILAVIYKKLRKKSLSPIILIVISAVLGVLLF